MSEAQRSAIFSSSLNSFASPDARAARSCKDISIDVKDLVITGLLSLAVRRLRHKSEPASSGVFVPQVIPSVGTLWRLRSNSSARNASDVSPDRDMTTA